MTTIPDDFAPAGCVTIASTAGQALMAKLAIRLASRTFSGEWHAKVRNRGAKRGWFTRAEVLAIERSCSGRGDALSDPGQCSDAGRRGAATGGRWKARREAAILDIKF